MPSATPLTDLIHLIAPTRRVQAGTVPIHPILRIPRIHPEVIQTRITAIRVIQAILLLMIPDFIITTAATAPTTMYFLLRLITAMGRIHRIPIRTHTQIHSIHPAATLWLRRHRIFQRLKASAISSR